MQLLVIQFKIKTFHTGFMQIQQLLHLITRTILGEKYRSLSSSLCSFLHALVTSSLLGPNIFLNTLFSNPLSLPSSLNPLNTELNPICHFLALLGAHHILHVSRIRVNVSDQVSYPYKTTGKIIVLHISILKFLDSELKAKYSAPNDSKHTLTSVCS